MSHPAKSSLLPLVRIDLPDYTDEQLQRDTIRAFNGWALSVHEYKVKVDENGLLVVTLDPDGMTGKAEWERVTAVARTAYYDQQSLPASRRGDVNYVDDVEKQIGF